MALVAVAVTFASAGVATAAPTTVGDTTAADFAAGTTAGTVVRSGAADDGSVELARTLEEDFAGSALPGAFSSTPWPSGGDSSVSGGAVSVDGARLDSGVTAGPGATLEFTATFGTQRYQHVGFVSSFDDGPWAMFSTNSSDSGTVYARVNDGAGGASDVALPSVDPGPHKFRIEWTDAGFAFFVDGTPVHSDAIAVTTPMNAQASDYEAGGAALTIDDIALTTHVSSGMFTSHVVDAGDNRVTGATFAATSNGTSVSYETRSGPTATPDGSWSGWESAGDGAALITAKRYVQYRATLTTGDPSTTPTLGAVAVTFAIDDTAPVVTVAEPQISGGSATVAFDSDDAHATYACKLDGEAFAACTSPVSYTSLAAGEHVVSVRATDAVRNEGTEQRTFTITPPATGGGEATAAPTGTNPGAPASTGGGGVVVSPARDRSASRVNVSPRSVRSSKSGRVTFRLKCPRIEQRCRVTLALKRGGTRLAATTVTIRGGRTARVTLRLRRSAWTYLRTHARLKVVAVTVARDAAGNRATKHTKVLLRAPRRA